MRRRRGGQGGSALIELVVFVLPGLLLLLAYAVFYGRVLYHYEVAQKAAHHAARYLAGAAIINMGDAAQAPNEIAVALAIAQAGLRELNPGPNRGPFVTITCDGGGCLGINLPATVSVQVDLITHNELLGDFAPEIGNLPVQAVSTMRYVGN